MSAPRFLLWVPIVALALGQVQGPSPEARTQPDTAQPPTFRTAANYVRVDAFATINDTPVTDLRQEEFEVLENGVIQKVEAFERVVVSAAGPQTERREPNTVAQSRADLADPRARVFVLFLDPAHVTLGGSHNIRRALIQTLDRVIGQDDLIGVMTPDMAASDVAFARKTTTIEGILTRYWYWGERDWINPVDKVEEIYLACYPSAEPIAREMIERRREKHTIDALRDLALFLRGVREERKAILTISSGWKLFRPNPNLARPVEGAVPAGPPIGVDPRSGRLAVDPRRGPFESSFQCDRDRTMLAHLDLDREFRDMLEDANRANASFYPVDPRGLAVFDSDIGPRRPPPPSVDAAILRSRLEALRTLAVATDGVAIVDTNDLSRGLQRVVADLTSYYLLGYYSTNTKPDGRYRSITVRVKRPGVSVRARRGYRAPTEEEVARARATAAPASPAEAAAAAEARVVEAAVGSLASVTREVPLRVRVTAGWKRVAGGEPAPLIVAVAEVSGDDWKAGGEADVALTGEDGASVATARAAFAPGTRRVRVPLEPSRPLAPGTYVVRVRARDALGSGVPSTDAVRVELPAPPGAAGALLFRRGATTANRDVPTADVRFRRSEQIRVEVPRPAGDAPAGRLLDRTGKPLAVPVSSTLREDADGARWQTAQLALAPLAAGDYLIELTTGAPPEQTRTLVPFRIVP